MAEIFFFADSFIAFFTGNCKALGTELTGVSHRSSLVGVQAAHMGLAGLDQIQQAGGVQITLPRKLNKLELKSVIHKRYLLNILVYR